MKVISFFALLLCGIMMANSAQAALPHEAQQNLRATQIHFVFSVDDVEVLHNVKSPPDAFVCQLHGMVLEIKNKGLNPQRTDELLLARQSKALSIACNGPTYASVPGAFAMTRAAVESAHTIEFWADIDPGNDLRIFDAAILQ